MGHSQQEKIHLQDIQPMNNQLGIMHQVLNAKSSEAIMDGQFYFSYQHNGLSVHSVQAEELQNISSSLELQPGLSFNLIFKGQIDICLAGQQYRLGNNYDSKIECSAITLANPDILTRYLKRGSQIRKVNVYVQRTWLEKHCHNHSHLQQLNQLFLHHGVVRKWQASQQLIDFAEPFFQPDYSEQLSSQLRSEYLAIRLVSVCIQELAEFLNQEDKTHLSTPIPNKSQQYLKQQIDQQLLEDHSLAHIAGSLGISISTLQRKFKQCYQITVIEYIRQRRLEMARSALTLEGLSIGEASYLAGYKHPSNFISAFKKQFAITPSELIKAHRMPSQTNRF